MPASVKHVVVLALENRSFDSMLGKLRADIDGLKGTETNPSPNGDVQVWNQPGLNPATMSIPRHEHAPARHRTLDGDPVMQGLALSYAKRPAITSQNANAVVH